MQISLKNKNSKKQEKIATLHSKPVEFTVRLTTPKLCVHAGEPAIQRSSSWSRGCQYAHYNRGATSNVARGESNCYVQIEQDWKPAPKFGPCVSTHGEILYIRRSLVAPVVETVSLLRDVSRYDVWSDKSILAVTGEAEVPFKHNTNTGSARWSTKKWREPSQHAIPLGIPAPSISVERAAAGRDTRHPHFQLHPQAPQRQRVDASRFQRAMLTHIQPTVTSSIPDYNESVTSALSETTSSVAASSKALSNSRTQAGVVSEVEQNITVDSDAESVETSAFVAFGPLVKMNKAQEKKREQQPWHRGRLMRQARHSQKISFCVSTLRYFMLFKWTDSENRRKKGDR